MKPIKTCHQKTPYFQNSPQKPILETIDLFYSQKKKKKTNKQKQKRKRSWALFPNSSVIVFPQACIVLLVQRKRKMVEIKKGIYLILI